MRNESKSTVVSVSAPPSSPLSEHLALERNLIAQHRDPALKPRAQIDLIPRQAHRRVEQRASLLEHLCPAHARRVAERKRAHAYAQLFNPPRRCGPCPSHTIHPRCLLFGLLPASTASTVGAAAALVAR